MNKFRAVVTYEEYDSDLDYYIRDAAEGLNGDDIGSGLGFGERDHEFEFDERIDARQFCHNVRRWVRMKAYNGKTSYFRLRDEED